MITLVQNRVFPAASRDLGADAGGEARYALLDQLREVAGSTAEALGTSDVERVAESVVDLCKRLVPCDLAALVLPGPQTNGADPWQVVRAVYRATPELVPAQRDPPWAGGLLDVPIRTGTVLRTGDARGYARGAGVARDGLADDPAIGPLLAVPLLREGLVTGVLMVANRVGAPPFDEVEEAGAVQLAAMAQALVENARLRGELRSRSEGLEAINRDRRQAVLAISHDLRGPASSIRGYSELVADPRLSDQGRRAILSRIASVAAQLDRLANDFATAANLDAPDFIVSVVPLDAAELAREVVADYRVRDPSRTLEVILEPPVPGGATVVMADPDRLRQVLGNLLENALKYTAGPVSLAVARAGGEVRFRVCDSGPGIDPEVLDNIFEPFYRDATRNRGVGGMGLGLAIVRGLTQAMDGSVEVSSGPSGSCFTLSLPGEGPG
jgi:signal transduction histidine kinase